MSLAGNVNINIVSEKNVTIDDLLNEASIIWKYIKNRCNLITLKNKADMSTTTIDTKTFDQLTKDIRNKHSQFNASYPIVIIYMCQSLYSKKVFRQWLEDIKVNPWLSKSIYLESQAKYVKMLFTYLFPKQCTADIDLIYKNVLETLQDEDHKFTKKCEELKLQLETKENDLKQKNITELYTCIKNNKDDFMKNAATVRVISELSGENCVDFDKLINNNL